MCGCEKDNENANDEELKQCCGAKRCRRFMCLPYNDSYIIASQVLCVVAFLISWVWWASFIISVIAMVCIQLIWCFRQSKAGLIMAHVISVVAALLSLSSGIYILVAWKRVYWCDPFVMSTKAVEIDDVYYDDGYYDEYDFCQEQAWATVAFVDAALWLASAGCIIAFVASGRYAKWEDHWSSRQQQSHPAAVEIVSTQPAEITTANAAVATGTLSPVLSVAVAASAPPAYVSPEVIEKADEETPP